MFWSIFALIVLLGLSFIVLAVYYKEKKANKRRGKIIDLNEARDEYKDKIMQRYKCPACDYCDTRNKVGIERRRYGDYEVKEVVYSCRNCDAVWVNRDIKDVSK